MLPSDLPPPIPIVCPGQFPYFAEPPFRVADKAEASEQADSKISKEQATFEKTVKTFEEALANLPANHKAEVTKLHGEVDTWANRERSAGKKADKLATFVGKVMTYLHKRLLLIEKNDPQLTRLKDEHRQLQKLFLQGDDVINAYLAWVKVKNDPIDQESPKKI